MLSGILAIALCIAATVVSIGVILVVVDRLRPASEPIQNLKIVSSTGKDGELTGLKNADRLQQYSDFQMARAVSKRLVAAEAVPELIGFGAVTMAFAPATADINAPFSELLVGDANQFDAHTTLPRTRPEKILIGHGPLRRGPSDHKWAANMLPAHVNEAKQQDCLARGIYFEARGEPERGQVAIGQVILNRVKNPAFPSKICDVVYQNFEQRNACQFSFACDGIEDRIRSIKHYKIAQQIAREVTDGTTFLYEIGDSTHFHTTAVRPKWAGELTKTDRIGQHIFYRTKNGGWS
jgi:spore germination cell wall hydrolase CwlJ-like protein